MLKFLKFFKKKEKKGEGGETKQAEIAEPAVAEKKISNEELEKEIIIHVMPKQFLGGQQNTVKAKRAGLFILIGGFLFLIAVSASLYYILFKLEPAKNKPTAGVPSSQNGQEIKTATTSEKENYPAPVNTATTTLVVETEPATSTDATSTQETYIAGVDSDGDGLTDKEEMILKTSAESVDSDGDSYSDLTEIMNLYNPSVYANGRLLNNPNIKEYANSTFNYRVFYPAAWTAGSIGGSDSIMFNSGDNHFVQIIAQPNAGNETISDWYKREFSVGEIPVLSLISGQGWSGIKSDDGLIIYLIDADNNYIFIVAYNTGGSVTLEYKNIFAMMVKSLSISQ